MRLNGKSVTELEPPPSLQWLEKHHPGRAIDLDERDFVEEVWNAAQLAVLTPLLGAGKEEEPDTVTTT